jgi:DNA-directed RNA polymerase specialized sigma24 family protein
MIIGAIYNFLNFEKALTGIHPLKKDQPNIENQEIPAEQQQFLLKVIPLIKQVATRKLSSFSSGEGDDIVQRVFLKLWKWIGKNDERKLDEESWQKLANTATQNEIKTFYSHKSNKEVLFTDKYEVVTQEASGLVAGNSNYELNSLAMSAWKEIKNLSLRQKYALLLQKQELILYLAGSKCCKIEEIARQLELPKERFLEIYGLLPFSDEQIREIFFETTKEKLSSKQIWEARSKARTKLSKILK